MDINTFIASIIESLAWPLAIIFIAFLFRHSLAKLIPSLTSFKYGNLEFEFNDQLKEVKRMLSESEPQHVSTAPKQASLPNSKYFRSLAEVSPRAAILEAWMDFEQTANTAMNKMQPGQEGRSATMPQLFNKLEEENLLTASEVGALTKLRALRNQVVHGPEPDLSMDTVNDYASMLSDVTEILDERMK